MLTRVMPPLLLSFGVALALVPPAAPPSRADEVREADLDRGKALLTEGDELADGGEPTEAVLRYKQAFEHILPKIRKVPFRREVKRDVTPREEMPALVKRELEEEMTPEEFHADEVGMKALGLIPRDLDLKETMVRVYAEEIAAFYDTKTETMHLIREPAEASRKPSFLERLLGKTGGFDKDENKAVIAHELTHALADQNYDLDALQDATKDDDRELALMALVEGEATLTMLAVGMDDWEGKQIRELPASFLETTFNLIMPFLPASSGRALREAPPILSEAMIFPYLRGVVFCARLVNQGGWDALDAAYREPPLSTEQILHPEAYRGPGRDVPMTVALGSLEPGPGWTEAGRNVVGEMQLAVLLRSHGGKAAAAGWDGDRFAAFEGPDGRLGLVWRTTWDTEDDAREFARHYARFQTTKLGPDIPEPSAFPDALRRPHRGAIFAVERRGPDVVVVEGFPSDATERLIESAFAATLEEKARAKR